MSKLTIAIVGLGGAVGTTMAAGLELLRLGKATKVGLPLAAFENCGLIPYEEIEVCGWDIVGDDLHTACIRHSVLPLEQITIAADYLKKISPLPAPVNSNYSPLQNGNNILHGTLAELSKTIRNNIRDFSDRTGQLVVLNLASTERINSYATDDLKSPEVFEASIAENSAAISPAMLFAYAAIKEGVPYANFTPSIAADLEALKLLAAVNNVPIAGKDGKTGQTFLKTVIAPALRDRALHVDGWYSTNILGNRDGLALSDENALQSKLKTKESVLDEILGYHVEDHIVDIRYYRPRGDNKEAWDNIDITGFLGQPMQIKVNFLCRDSILAAPLAIEVARCLALAASRKISGVVEELSVFFKSPMFRSRPVTNDFFLQQKLFMDWLAQADK